MQRVTPPGLGFSCSKFIFGTGGLFSVGDASSRSNLLAAAVDHGFTHFDCAPLYGFGLCERDLARILKGRPELTVTTKVGLYPPGGLNQSSWSVFARKAVGKVFKAVSKPLRRFDLATAQRSLEGSLRRLGRDHVDLYLLHEPLFEEICAESWIAWLEGRVRAGQIRRYGMASPMDFLQPFLSKKSALTEFVQTLDSVDAKEADALKVIGQPLQITYGYLWSARKRADKRPALEILRLAVQRNRCGAVVVSTSRIERIAQYARVLEPNA